MDAEQFKPKKVQGFSVSQIGYDAGRPKQAVLRSMDINWLKDCRFEVIDVYNGKVYFEADVVYWGEKWGSFWWQTPFTDLYREGMYTIRIYRNDIDVIVSDPFRVAENVLWKETVQAVAFTQFEERAKLARNGSGWKDCGSDWRECGSHTFTLIGLCDMLSYDFEFLSLTEQKRLADIIRTGCRYLCVLMDKAESVGYPLGSIAHEMPNHGVVLPGDIASSSYVLGYASRLLFEFYPEEATDWLKRSKAAFLRFQMVDPWTEGGFSGLNRGLPETFQPEGFMTRDLMMHLWAGLQLYSSGILSVKESLLSLTKQILARQIQENEAESGFWGHFREFENTPHSEKANTHHHVGHDTGTVIAFNVLPLLEMCQRFYDHPSAPAIQAAILNFVDHFIIPACRANPFHLLPQGVFGEEGLLDFCGPWHGTNVSYGYFASMAFKLAAFTDRPYLYEAAMGNIQWICGLNAGVTQESMAGSVYWRETIAEGQAVSYSQIIGVGHRSVGGWTDIRGTILNGFSTNPQFTLQVEPNKENDGPWLYTDEDWVPHAGGFISAISLLRNHFSVPWNG